MPRKSTKKAPKTELLDLSQTMTAEEAAVALGVSVGTVFRWRQNGVLRGEKILARVFFDRKQVEELVEELTKKRHG